jgi:tetratricopeptide (TPR) repeat protein
MAESAWLRMRQAREALKQGRLEEAWRNLEGPLQQGYWPAFRLARRLAHAFAVRAQRALQANQREAAWHSLLMAELLHPENRWLSELRQQLTERELRRVRVLIGRRNTTEALGLLERLRDWKVPEEIVEPLIELASDWQQLLSNADRGQFTQAWQIQKRLQVPEWLQEAYQQLLEELQQRQGAFEAALPRLLQAAEKGCHQAVILASREVLAAAPHFTYAQSLEQRSWQLLGSITAGLEPGSGPAATLPHIAARSHSRIDPPPVTRLDQASHRPMSVSGGIPTRLLLWVDQVGGYLVCLASPVSIGGHSHHHPPTIPLCVNLPRCFAEFGWDSEGFWLCTTHAPVYINGQPARQQNLLHDGDRIVLGHQCELWFRQPHPQLGTALLQFTSGKPPLSLQGVILMGQQLVFGPAEQVHIRLPPCEQLASGESISLCRCPEGLGLAVPAQEMFTVHRQGSKYTCQQWGVVQPDCTVEWGPYRFTLESDVALRLDSH